MHVYVPYDQESGWIKLIPTHKDSNFEANNEGLN